MMDSIFEKNLQEQMANLKRCQESQQLDSCLKCEKTIQCEIRKAYVKSVYESMNGGGGGDFEF